MKIAILQTQIEDYNIEQNLQHFHSLLEKIEEDTQWVVLPEMFLTGFISDTSYAEQSKREGLKLMRDFAQSKGIAIEGSLIIEENGKYLNRHYFITKDKEYYYDKVHLFSLSKEAEVLSKGKERDVIVEYEGIKIKMLTCYDLRFPYSSMNRVKDDVPIYDFLVYVASWPKSRRTQWQTLLTARAIENQCFVIGVNREGLDGDNTEYSGDSCIINSRGIFLEPTHTDNSIQYYDVDTNSLTISRKKFPVWKDWDNI